MQRKRGANRWQEAWKREWSECRLNINPLRNVTTHFKISRNWEQGSHSEERTSGLGKIEKVFLLTINSLYTSDLKRDPFCMAVLHTEWIKNQSMCSVSQTVFLRGPWRECWGFLDFPGRSRKVVIGLESSLPILPSFHHTASAFTCFINWEYE